MAHSDGADRWRDEVVYDSRRDRHRTQLDGGCHPGQRRELHDRIGWLVGELLVPGALEGLTEGNFTVSGDGITYTDSVEHNVGPDEVTADIAATLEPEKDGLPRASRRRSRM